MVTARALESGRAVGAGTAEGSSDEFSEDPFGGSNGYLQASLQETTSPNLPPPPEQA